MCVHYYLTMEVNKYKWKKNDERQSEVPYLGGLESAMIKQVIPSKLDDRNFFCYRTVHSFTLVCNGASFKYGGYFGPKIPKSIGHLVFQAWCIIRLWIFWAACHFCAYLFNTSGSKRSNRQNNSNNNNNRYIRTERNGTKHIKCGNNKCTGINNIQRL